MGTISEQTKTSALQGTPEAQLNWVKDEILEFVASLQKSNKLESALEAFDLLGLLVLWPQHEDLIRLVVNTLTPIEMQDLFALTMNPRFYLVWSDKQTKRSRPLIAHSDLSSKSLYLLNQSLDMNEEVPQ